jgi:hypothetical protein
VLCSKLDHKLTKEAADQLERIHRQTEYFTGTGPIAACFITHQYSVLTYCNGGRHDRNPG